MSEESKTLVAKVSTELISRFPDMRPKIAEIKEQVIIYELEKHNNYTYFSVKYDLSPSGILTIDWESAELTVY